jgi:hypothetical protein
MRRAQVFAAAYPTATSSVRQRRRSIKATPNRKAVIVIAFLGAKLLDGGCSDGVDEAFNGVRVARLPERDIQVD